MIEVGAVRRNNAVRVNAPTSAVGRLVHFLRVGERTASKQYFGFMCELEDLYGRKVDIVERRGVRNPFFNASLEEQEVNVFAAK
jgi:predicted nucleotidyltransferase